MIIIGIDPGFARIGYGIIQKNRSSYRVLDFGCITTSPQESFPSRLVQIEKDLRTILKKYHPDCCSIENLFFFKNSKTAFSVSAARGVLILTAKKYGISVFEYTPLQIKQAVTGYGKASKSQVMIMIKKLLLITNKIVLDDTSDALAAAMCHGNSLRNEKINLS